MARWLAEIIRGVVAQGLRDLRLGALAVVVSLPLIFVAAGFGTFGLYVFLAQQRGTVVAALIVAIVYAILAGAVWLIIMARMRAGRTRHAQTAPVNNIVDAALRLFDAPGTQQDQVALAAAVQMARELSPLQVLAVSVIGGFMVGRNLKK